MTFEYCRPACAVHSTYGVAIPHAVADTQDEPGRELSIVDGLVSVTRRAWTLSRPERNYDLAGGQ